MNQNHVLEEVRENPSPPVMTQPFALHEDSIQQQVEQFDTSNYAESECDRLARHTFDRLTNYSHPRQPLCSYKRITNHT